MSNTGAIPLMERLVYSRPDYESDEVPLVGRPWTAFLGRILLGALFVLAGTLKLVNVDATYAHMEAAGLPAVDVLLPVAAFAEILGGASLILGVFARVGALGLVLFMIPTTLIFH